MDRHSVKGNYHLVLERDNLKLSAWPFYSTDHDEYSEYDDYDEYGEYCLVSKLNKLNMMSKASIVW